jgi:hypothetical protein
MQSLISLLTSSKTEEFALGLYNHEACVRPTINFGPVILTTIFIERYTIADKRLTNTNIIMDIDVILLSNNIHVSALESPSTAIVVVAALMLLSLKNAKADARANLQTLVSVAKLSMKFIDSQDWMTPQFHNVNWVNWLLLRESPIPAVDVNTDINEDAVVERIGAPIAIAPAYALAVQKHAAIRYANVDAA